MPSIAERVLAIVAPLVEQAGLELYDLEHTGGAVRVLVSGPAGAPVGVDDLAGLTRAISRALDAEDPIEGRYTLEVSSPGIERPVQRLADFARFVGFRARLRLEEGLPRRRYTRRIARVDGETVELEVDGVVHPIAFASIDAAHLVLDLSGQPRAIPDVHRREILPPAGEVDDRIGGPYRADLPGMPSREHERLEPAHRQATGPERRQPEPLPQFGGEFRDRVEVLLPCEGDSGEPTPERPRG